MAKSILIFAPGSLGDTLMICPALKFIRKMNLDLEITMVFDTPRGRSKLTPDVILEGYGLIDKFVAYHPFEKERPLCSLWAIVKLLFSLMLRFDSAYYLVETWTQDNRLARDKFFFKLCGIKHLMHFDAILDRPNPEEETISRASEALYRAGMCDALNLSAVDLDYDYEHFSQNEPKGQKKSYFYVMSPFSNMQSKNWSLERYRVVTQWLFEKYGFKPIILGSTDDIVPAKQFLERLRYGKSLCGQLTFEQTKHVIKNCAFYFGNDSGLMHLSAALGLQCFAIFSARDFRGRWVPLGYGHRCLRNLSVKCAGCQELVCQNKNYNECLDRITTDECLIELNYFIEDVMGSSLKANL